MQLCRQTNVSVDMSREIKKLTFDELNDTWHNKTICYKQISTQRDTSLLWCANHRLQLLHYCSCCILSQCWRTTRYNKQNIHIPILICLFYLFTISQKFSDPSSGRIIVQYSGWCGRLSAFPKRTSGTSKTIIAIKVKFHTFPYVAEFY
jgi:hypothetical protein